MMAENGQAGANEQAARVELRDVYRRIEQVGLSIGNAGNISIRFGEHMLISPTGADGATIRPEDFVLTRLDGTALSPGVPSSEWAIHAAVYQAGLGGSVIHAHPDHCVALSCLRKPIPAFHYMVASFGGKEVPCAPYAVFGSAALAEGVIEALRLHNACLMANHGMVCRADSLKQALARAIKLEMLARQYCLAKQTGAVVMLDDAEMDTVLARYAEYGSGRLPSEASKPSAAAS
jgi:L-fuculose-phosphate aldolase